MTPKEIDKFEKRFNEWYLEDIRIILDIHQGKPFNRTSDIIHKPFMAAVILFCCGIDCLSKFRYGQIVRKSKKGRIESINMNGDNLSSRKCYIDFVKEYFIKEITYSKKTYDSNILYDDIRCQLVHGYTLDKQIAFTHTPEYVKKHTIKSNIPIIIEYKNKGLKLVQLVDKYTLDVFLLLKDLEHVFYYYIKELKNNKYIDEFMFRWKNNPLIGPSK